MGNESQKRCHKNLQKNKSHRTLKIEKMKQILDVNIYILSLYNIATYTVYILNNVIINFIASLCPRGGKIKHNTELIFDQFYLASLANKRFVNLI